MFGVGSSMFARRATCRYAHCLDVPEYRLTPADSSVKGNRTWNSSATHFFSSSARGMSCPRVPPSSTPLTPTLSNVNPLPARNAGGVHVLECYNALDKRDVQIPWRRDDD